VITRFAFPISRDVGDVGDPIAAHGGSKPITLRTLLGICIKVRHWKLGGKDHGQNGKRILKKQLTEANI